MKEINVRSMGVIVLACLMAVAMGGCSNDPETSINPGLTASDPSSGSGSEITTIEGLPEFDETILFTEDRGLGTIFFDYNSYALRPDALETLQANASMIKNVPSVVIQIEGHCDERGTQEYNLALGERRALATREHLINLGISGDRLITISYGEEDPVATGHDESAWSQNRRSQFNRAM
ncbi:MAG: peptidoglycan-associated lipoprotein Pal [Candidatus Hydrogenedentes bacterium]|nr:peptidoglycan-associated lipoprotein Pal [Candidatus Hydrogenedentota bacterium]